MGGKRLALLAACCAALLVPAGAGATTVTLGPTVLPKDTGGWNCDPSSGCTAGFTVAQVSSLHVNEVPADGTIKTWRVSGEGRVNLHVLRAGEEEGISYFGHGVSAPATNLSYGDNTTSLPVRAGDVIGVDVGGPGGLGGEVDDVHQPGAEHLFFDPTPPAFGVGIPTVKYDDELFYNADVVLAPVVAAIDPAQGSTAGGNAVSIFGQYLDGATGVTFGTAPASSFVVESASRIIAVAPASVTGAVDVHVIGPGGSSETVTGDQYTFTASPGTAAAPGPGNGTPSGGPAGKPTVSSLGQTATRWRRGQKLPRISRAGGPIGTTFSFSLSEAATARFAFQRHATGRRVNGRCVAVTPGNAGKRRCARALDAGGFSLAGHTGVNKVFFQGRLSNAKTLRPGNYTLVLKAHSRGLDSESHSVSFTIVS